MKCDFNEFLRIMTLILIILLVIQGLDYIFGCGVNNYLFILFCIVFAFTIGAIYHNILSYRKKNSGNECLEDEIKVKLSELQDEINVLYEEQGLTDEVLNKQIVLNNMRNALNMSNESDVITCEDCE